MNLKRSYASRHPGRAFTLLEVMIASGIFFMAIFAILALVSSNLRNARLLAEPQVDGGMLLADLSLTNKFYEGSDSGDFGNLYPGYHWASEVTQVGTNGYFQVDYIVTRPGGGANADRRLRAFFYRPDSPAGAGY
jgi:Tfp pilus assembly protein PilV